MHKTNVQYRTFFQKQEKKYCIPLWSESSKFNRISFHGFPIYSDLRGQWLVNICRDNFTISSHTKICSRHFATDHLLQPTTLDGRRRLVKGNVPAVFEWNGCTAEIARLNVQERTERPASRKSHEHRRCSTLQALVDSGCRTSPLLNWKQSSSNK